MKTLTLAFMQTCYVSCCFGSLEPTHMIMSEGRREELRRRICSSTATPLPPSWCTANGPLGFNAAKIIGLPYLDENFVWVVSVDRPDLEGLNSRIEIE